MGFPIDLPACLFVGGMALLLAVAYFWFEKGGANYSTREKTWMQMLRFTPRISPKVEDDERRLRDLEKPDDITQEKGWEEKL